MQGNDRTKSDGEHALLGGAADTVPLDARGYARRMRLRESVRWLSMVFFGLIVVVIGGRIFWAHGHIPPILEVGSGLEILDGQLIDREDLGLADVYRVAEIEGIGVSSVEEYFEAIDGRAGEFVEIRMVGAEGGVGERRFFIGMFARFH